MPTKVIQVLSFTQQVVNAGVQSVVNTVKVMKPKIIKQISFNIGRDADILTSSVPGMDAGTLPMKIEFETTCGFWLLHVLALNAMIEISILRPEPSPEMVARRTVPWRRKSWAIV